MAIRNFVLLSCFLAMMMIGCGKAAPKPPSDAELKAMNDKMTGQMESMKLPAKPSAATK